MYRIQQYVNVIVKIIDRFTVHPLRPSPGSLRETLHAMCDIPQAFGFIEEGVLIVKLMQQRESQSSQVIVF